MNPLWKISLKLIAVLFISIAVLTSCTPLRTEIFREETLHLYKHACSLYKQGDYENARTEFETVIAYDPDYGPAHAALGNLAMIAEDYPLAREHYRKAIEVDPELEPELSAMLMVTTAHTQREPLQKAGVDLNRIYPLVMGEKQAELEALLEKEFPLDLLARDNMSITPGKLGEMQAKTAGTVRPDTGSVRYRLFCGYLLFYGQTNDAQAAQVLKATAPQAETADRQKALVILGQLYERIGRGNDAADAYLAAVAAGLPLADVAHHLARLYRVDIASVLPEKAEAPEESERPEPMGIEIKSSLPPQTPSASGNVPITPAGGTAGTERQHSRNHF